MDWRVKPGNDRNESTPTSSPPGLTRWSMLTAGTKGLAASACNTLPQIAPVWIERADQIDLPLARPMLDVLFALNRGHGSCVLFVVDQHLDAVRFREAATSPSRCS